MDEVSKLKKQVAIYGLAVIAVCEIVPFLLLFWISGYPFSACLGFAAALVNFWLLAFFLQKMLDSGNADFATIKLVNQDMIVVQYFLSRLKQGPTPSWVGCLILGYSHQKFLSILQCVKPDFNTKRKVRPEVQAMYEQEDKEKDDEYWGRKED